MHYIIAGILIVIALIAILSIVYAAIYLIAYLGIIASIVAVPVAVGWLILRLFDKVHSQRHYARTIIQYTDEHYHILDLLTLCLNYSYHEMVIELGDNRGIPPANVYIAIRHLRNAGLIVKRRSRFRITTAGSLFLEHAISRSVYTSTRMKFEIPPEPPSIGEKLNPIFQSVMQGGTKIANDLEQRSQLSRSKTHHLESNFDAFDPNDY